MLDPAKQPFDVQKARESAIDLLKDIVDGEDEYPVAERRQAAKALLDALGEMPNGGAELLVLELTDEELVDIIARERLREAEVKAAADVPRETPPAAAVPVPPAAPRQSLADLLAGVADFSDPLADPLAGPLEDD